MTETLLGMFVCLLAYINFKMTISDSQFAHFVNCLLLQMDKATVLEDAYNYILQLQSRVKELEDTCVKGKDIIQESADSLGRSKYCGRHEDVASSSDDADYLPSSSTCSPEIKVRISGSKILVRIYCMKSSSIVLKTLTELARLHITIICCSVLPFDTTHLVTITAQVIVLC